MNAVILLIIFIISDLFLLFNTITLQITERAGSVKIKSIKAIALVIFYIAYSILFIKFFKPPNKALMSILLIGYYLRLWIVSVGIIKRITFSSIYCPLLICSLDSLFQSCVFCVLHIFSMNIDIKLCNKISSLIFETLILLFLNFILNRSIIERIKFALNKLSRAICILILSCIFILDAIVSLIKYTTQGVIIITNVLALFLIILMFIIFVIMILLLINNMSKQYFEDTSNLLEKQIQTQLAHYNSLKELKSEYHSFRHDYINHMHCLSFLINAGKKAEALEYINKLSESKIIFEKPYETGSDILDSILAEKAEYAKQYGIKVKADGLFTTEFEPVDLCIIFSNALDNAVEACRNFDGEKVINVVLNIRQNHQLISVSNPFSGDLSVNKGSFVSSKKDTERHGFGLKNIQAVAEKHCGTMEVVCKNGIFYLNVVLKM